MVLHDLIAVRADCRRHDETQPGGVDLAHYRGNQCQELLGLVAGIDRKQLLRLIQRQYERGRQPVLPGVG